MKVLLVPDASAPSLVARDLVVNLPRPAETVVDLDAVGKPPAAF